MRKTIIRTTTFIYSLIMINVGFASFDENIEEQVQPQIIAAVENKIFGERDLIVTSSLEKLIDMANGGDGDAQDEIVKRFASGNIHVRFAKLKPWVRMGEVEIDEQYVFFYLCWRGALMTFHGIDPEYDQMIIKRAKEGSAIAQNCLGYMYEKGIRVCQNSKKALKWLSRAAEQGYAPAIHNLGAYYGNEQQMDMAKALELSTQAAEQGVVAAQCFLGALYLTNTSGCQDYEKSFKWNKMAAAQGHPIAQETLALMYIGDNGIPRNLAESLRWMILSGSLSCLRLLSMLSCATFNENEPQSSTPATKEDHQSSLNQLYLYANQFGLLEDLLAEDHWVAPIFRPLCVSFMHYVNRLSRLSNHLENSPVLGTCFELSEKVERYLDKQENPAFFHVYHHDDGKNYLTIGSDYVKEIRDIDTLLALPTETPCGHGRYDKIAEQLMFHAISTASMELGEDIAITINSIIDLAFSPIDNLSQAKSCLDLFERSYSIALSKLKNQKTHLSRKTLQRAQNLLKQALDDLTQIKGKTIQDLLQGSLKIIMRQIDDVGRRNHLCLKDSLYEPLVNVWTSEKPDSGLFVLRETRWDGQALFH